jgi:hypothetical protein
LAARITGCPLALSAPPTSTALEARSGVPPKIEPDVPVALRSSKTVTGASTLAEAAFGQRELQLLAEAGELESAPRPAWRRTSMKNK